MKYEEVNLRDARPDKNGWYFIVGDDYKPRECGRAFFHVSEHKWTSPTFDWCNLINNNSNIFWLRRIDS